MPLSIKVEFWIMLYLGHSPYIFVFNSESWHNMIISNIIPTIGIILINKKNPDFPVSCNLRIDAEIKGIDIMQIVRIYKTRERINPRPIPLDLDDLPSVIAKNAIIK